MLALRYFQGMACYRSASLRSNRDLIYLKPVNLYETQTGKVIFLEIHSNIPRFSKNNKSVATDRLEPVPSNMGFSLESSTLPAELYEIYNMH